MLKLSVMVFVLFSMVFIGCSSKPIVETPDIGGTGGVGVGGAVCFNGAPDWVIVSGEGENLSAVGVAVIGKSGLQYARIEATAAARDEMARTLSIKVNNMFKTFNQTTGLGDDQSIDRVTVNVSKQLASQTISGSKQIGSWVSQCAELYVLVGLDETLVKQAVKEESISSIRNDVALWQQFLEKQAQDELDAAIEKEFKNTVTID